MAKRIQKNARLHGNVHTSMHDLWGEKSYLVAAWNDVSASLTGAAEVDDQPTSASSCGLLEARERLAEGPG